MKKIVLKSTDKNSDFTQAKLLAEETAAVELEEPVLLSWYDAIRDRESPSGVSECHSDCDVPGCVEYAQNRGGRLIVDIDNGSYLFCYRELGEFSE
ncbi:AF1514 family protein [bacterium]|nr:AF1514 family protein [bacterium]